MRAKFLMYGVDYFNPLLPTKRGRRAALMMLSTKELFYIALDGRLMAVAIRIASSVQFATRVGPAANGTTNLHWPAISDDRDHRTSPLTDHGHLDWKAKP